MNFNPSNLGANFSFSDEEVQLFEPPFFTGDEFACGEEEEVRATVEAASIDATRGPDPFIFENLSLSRTTSISWQSN